MKALTIWQPWASLIMIGAKPYEFRRWDYRAREPGLVGQRIVIHAGSRPVKPSDITDLFARIDAGESALRDDVARPLLERLRDAHKCRGVVELSAGLGTAVLGAPRNAAILFRGKVADSSRLDHSMWAWPLTDIVPFQEPKPMRGFQGFWTWPERIAA